MNAELEIPGYIIKRHLGTGGMCSVYLAEQLNFGREVALKIMTADFARQGDFGQRFLREVRIAALLSHPNIVTVYDTGSIDGIFYLAMEYLANGDLESQFAAGMSLELRLSVVEDVANALDYAASKGVVHRDIKPSNIMFREDGSVVIVDFGIARELSTETKVTQVGTIIGTPHYMSPEQSVGETIDGRSDIYSLGIILYELLTGGVPFSADSAAAIGMKHLSQEIPRLPQGLEMFQAIIDKVLAKKRRSRYQDGEALCRDIADIVQTLPDDLLVQLAYPDGIDSGAIRPPSGSLSSRKSGKKIRRDSSELRRSRRFLTRNRLLVGIALASVVFLLPLAWLYFRSAQETGGVADAGAVANSVQPGDLVAGAGDSSTEPVAEAAQSGQVAGSPETGNEGDLKLNLLVLDYVDRANAALQAGMVAQSQKYLELASALAPEEPWLIAMIDDANTASRDLLERERIRSDRVDRVNALIAEHKLYLPAGENAYTALAALAEVTSEDDAELSALGSRTDDLSRSRISELLSRSELSQAATELEALAEFATPQLVEPLRQRLDTLSAQAASAQSERKRLLAAARRLEQSAPNTQDQSLEIIRLYRQVLDLEPGNATARAGVERELSQQLDDIRRFLDLGELNNARGSIDALKAFNLDPGQLEMRLVRQESLRSGALDKLAIARTMLDQAGVWEMQLATSPELNQQYSSTLIGAYRSAILAEEIDKSTPGVAESIETIESKYRSGFEQRIASEEYRLAAVYFENLQRSGITKPDALRMLEEMSGALNRSKKQRPKSLPSF